MDKKLFFGIFAAAGMLFAASCSDDKLETAQPGGETQVAFSLGLEGGMGTRAISDGTGADKLVYSVFDAEGKRVAGIAQVSKEGVAFPTTEILTLAKGQTYKVAFWAQDNDCKAYTVSDDMKVTVDYGGGTNNDEARDAFFKTVEFTVTGSAAINVEMKRPFAQINMGVTTEDWDAAVASGIEIGRSSATVKQAASEMDLVTGETSKPVDVTYGLAGIPAESLSADADGDGTKEEYHWLSMGYFLVNDGSEDGAQKATVESLEFTLKPLAGNDIVVNEGLNSVPVQRNWRTNILGKLLTGDIKFNITIDPIYEGDINLSGDALALEEIMKNGGFVRLSENVTITKPLVVTSGKTVEIDLNGNDIINTTSLPDGGYGNTTVFEVKDGATLNIKGEGKVHAISNEPNQDGYRMAVYALGNSTVNIYGGDFYNNQDYNNGNAQLDLIYADQDAVINIYGGRFESACHNNRGYWVLNLKDNSNAAINVYGGTFVNFDPAQSKTENPEKNFVAEGYSSVKTSDDPVTYTVVKGVAVSATTGIEDAIAEAISNGSNTIYTTKAISFNENVELDGRGVTFEGSPVHFNEDASIKNVVFANGTNSSGNGSAVYVTSGSSKNITFEGCTFINAEWDAIQLTNKDIESVTIKDCIFKNTVKGYRYIHLELRDGNSYVENTTATLTISGCTFENVTKDYCKDSAITITGFKFNNMTLENNIVKGAVGTLDSNVFWICDGNNFSNLMSETDINQAFIIK